MYSIVEINGRQIWVETGRIYTTNHLPLKPGSQVNLTRILLTKEPVSESNELKIKVGKPYIKRTETKTNVKVTILNHSRKKKVIVYKMKPKKKMQRKMGHRQSISKFVVTEII